MFICSINIRPLVSNFQRKLSLADNGLAVSSSSSVSKCLQTLGQNVSAQIQEDSCLPACPRCTGLAEQLGDEVGHLQPCWTKAPREVMRRTWLHFEICHQRQHCLGATALGGQQLSGIAPKPQGCMRIICLPPRGSLKTFVLTMKAIINSTH